MEKEKILFTSESVSEGHPDKVCDQIADAVLDACLEKDENAHVACEVFASANFILIGGEITLKDNQNIDFDATAKSVLKKIGYNRPELGTDYHTVEVLSKVKTQSPNIAMGVNQEKPEDLGAGDQGIMFGYATNETKGYMPLPISIAHKLVREASNQRKNGQFKWARPDMKSQVTIDYTDPKDIKIDTILMSIQHDPDADLNEFKKYIHEHIMKKVAKSFHLNSDFKFLINPTGLFEIGGPAGDTGVTGRKIIVDTYGGSCEHGGGAFSGKDPTKVDRSATYMARYMAKNLVAAGVSDRLQIQLSYAIGVNHPLSIGIRTYHTAHYSDDVILRVIKKVFDPRPGMIIKNFSLTKPSFKYQNLTNYGHFGRPDLDLPWEQLDKVDEIKSLLALEKKK
ncbi:MAG TPA: methionine adenosyltransferase [Bacilli bacterium]|nr:methionine adenosyltransferase [Bacilli bacterium]HQA55752.1 methionine adenosyltransferase [Bacilli bacterium]